MTHWYMLTLVGSDRPGIVARVTGALYDGGCNLGEASMIRLGENFTIMLMVAIGQTADSAADSPVEPPVDQAAALAKLLEPVTAELGLQMHLNPIEGRLHNHVEPDVAITVYGADRAGIVARVTALLAGAGLNITDLESRVAGSREKPIYVMQVEGLADGGHEALEAAVESVRREGIEIHLQPMDTLIG